MRQSLLVLALCVVAALAGPGALADDMTTGPGAGTSGQTGQTGSAGHSGSAGQPGAAGNPGSTGSPGQSGSSSAPQVRSGSAPGGTRSVGPSEDFVNSNLPSADAFTPAVEIQPGPEPAPFIGKMPELPPQEPALTVGNKAAAVGMYLLSSIGLFVAATVLIPLDFITRLFGAGPEDRSGPRRASVRG